MRPVTSEPDFHAQFAQGPRFAREVRVSRDIEAPQRLVWETLIRFDEYPKWNPFTTRVVGTPEVGAPVELHVNMPGRPRVVQREWVNLVEAPHRICWGLHMLGSSMLTTNRFQVLEPISETRTRYTTWDAFSGWMVPLVFAIYGAPMARGFDLMAEALRVHCESLARQASATEVSKPS